MISGFPKVSIIVPVYNAARYLENCLQSLISQTLKEIEIIVINDGSTDSSLTIMKRYESADNRIRIIDQVNKGVSEARNAGIKLSHGAFIGFTDADDTVEPELYEKLYTAATENDCDFAVCNAKIIEENGNKVSRLNLKSEFIDFEKYRNNEIRNMILFKYDYGNWNKLFSRGVIQKYSIHFANHITKGEDLLFNLTYCLFCKKGVVVNKDLYNYYIREGSITQSNFTNLLAEFNKVIQYFEYQSSFLETNEKIIDTFRYEMAKSCFYELQKNIHFIIKETVPFSSLISKIKAEISLMKNPNYFKYLNYNDLPFNQKIKLWLFKHKLLVLYSLIALYYNKLICML